MSTTIRAELSEKNKYWVERHRYYELKHFCLQYPLWKKALSEIDGFTKSASHRTRLSKTNAISDPTFKYAEERKHLSDNIKMVENIAEKTDNMLSGYILRAVTEGIAYDQLRARYNIPCCKDIYYNSYRRFFWLLDKTRR